MVQIQIDLECYFGLSLVRWQKCIFSGETFPCLGSMLAYCSTLSLPYLLHPFSRSYVHIFVTLEPESRPHYCIPGLCFNFRNCQIRWFGSYTQSQRLQLLTRHSHLSFHEHRKDTCLCLTRVNSRFQTKEHLPERRLWKTAVERIVESSTSFGAFWAISKALPLHSVIAT